MFLRHLHRKKFFKCLINCTSVQKKKNRCPLITSIGAGKTMVSSKKANTSYLHLHSEESHTSRPRSLRKSSWDHFALETVSVRHARLPQNLLTSHSSSPLACRDSVVTNYPRIKKTHFCISEKYECRPYIEQMDCFHIGAN